jgi:hypothetical protein
MEIFSVLADQTWIGATALTPEEMAVALDKTLKELKYPFERVGEKIEYPPKMENFVFKVKTPSLAIAFYWNVPVCATYPLCPTLDECLWAYKPLGVVRMSPTSEETEAHLKKILSAWANHLPREIWRFNKEYLDFYVTVKGIDRAKLMTLNFLRKWARWGLTTFPKGAEDLPQGCLTL